MGALHAYTVEFAVVGLFPVLTFLAALLYLDSYKLVKLRTVIAVVVCGGRVLVSASDGPRGGRAGVYRGGLEGGAFERCRAGLPEWFDDNIDTSCLDALNDGTFAAFGTADGWVFGSGDGGETWLEVATGLPPIDHVLVVPDP